MPTRMRYEKDLQGVFNNLVLMCRYIEVAIEKCIKALTSRNYDLALEVYEDEKQVNRLEREIEQSCLRILLMEHPVAGDFREVSAALKMITDLERIGDQARDIAEITTQFKDREYVERLDNISLMAAIVVQMVKDSVQAYINRDLELARMLDTIDDKADALFNIIMSDLITQVKKDPDNAEQAIMLMMITKYLERIGDHAVNIGESIEFALTGSYPEIK